MRAGYYRNPRKRAWRGPGGGQGRAAGCPRGHAGLCGERAARWHPPSPCLKCSVLLIVDFPALIWCAGGAGEAGFNAPSPETTTSALNDVIRPIHCLTTHSTRAPSLCVLMEQAEATVRQHHDCRSDRGQSEEARPQALGQAMSTTRTATPRSTWPRGGPECSRCPRGPEVLSGKASSLQSGHVLRRLVLRCVFRPQPGPLGA